MNIIRNRLIGITTILLLISSEVFSTINADSTNFWNISDAPGSFNDPLKAITQYSPSYTISKLNRFDGIVRGSPQASAGYFVDGSPLITFSEISDVLTLSEQSILPKHLTTIIGTRLIFPVSPFFFDGYRSWFSEQRGMNITIDGSYAPVENGFFCGPRINIDNNNMSNDEKHAEANVTNYEATLNGMVSAGKNQKLFGSARIGYNPHPVQKWIKPYSWSGDVNPEFPLFANYRVGTNWQPSERLFIKVNLQGALERRSFAISFGDGKAPSESFRNYFVNNATAIAGWQISDAANSTTNIGFGYGDGEAGFSNYFSRGASSGAVSVCEKIQFFSNSKFSPYIGCDFRNSFNTTKESIPKIDATLLNTSVSCQNTQFAPFIGLKSPPADFITIDGGIRMDKYLPFEEKSSSCLAITPWKAVDESTSIDISYRFHSEISLTENFGASISSGLYNQLPADFELQKSKNLRSIKSSRHSFCQYGSFPFDVAYNGEVYIHQFWDIPVATIVEQNNSASDIVVSSGIKKSKGMELSLRYSPIPIFSVVIGYSLSWNDQFNVYTNDWVRADSDRRHKLSGLCEFKLPFGLDCATGFIFSSGAPYTPVISSVYDQSGYFYEPIYNRINSATGDSYANASLRISYARSFGAFSAGIYTEGCNLLQNTPDYGQTIWDGYSNDKVPHNIDQRTIAAGIVIKY